LEVSLYDLASGAGLGATGPDGDFRGTRVVVGTIEVSSPSQAPDSAELSVARPLDVPAGALRLTGMNQVAEQVLSGDFLSLELLWQAEEAPRVDHGVRLRLLDHAGEVALEALLPLSPYPTSQWCAGDRFRSLYRLHVSPDVTPGSHQLAFNTLDEGGAAISGRDASLATIQVLPRERSFTLPDIPHRLDVTFGETIHLRGYDLVTVEAVPGETLPLTLYFQAEGPTDRGYTLFVHLLGPNGAPSGQVDLVPGNGAAPTTSWAKGQVIVQQVALPVAPGAGEGTYRIALGFYDAAYGDRLPVAAAAEHLLPQDRALLPEEIAVEP
jgi:hypothetical protein